MSDADTPINKDVPLPSAEKYIVESGVPIPPARSMMGSKYPFKKMQVGDSFFFTDNVHSIRSLMQQQFGPDGERLRFSCRVEGHGWRVWRIA